MSSAASTNDSQTFRQEVLDRMAEQSPVLGIPRLIAADHLNKMMSASRRRVEDDHARQVAHLKDITGLEYDKQEVPSDEEEMISVAGDTVTNHYHVPKAAAASSLSPAVKYGAMALAGLGLPLIGAFLATWWNQPSPPVVVAPTTPSADTDTQYFFGIE